MGCWTFNRDDDVLLSRLSLRLTPDNACQVDRRTPRRHRQSGLVFVVVVLNVYKTGCNKEGRKCFI